MRYSVWAGRAALLGLGLLALGCGSKGSRVKGKVLLDGQPLADANVIFWPKHDLELGTYRGKTGPDGTFEMKGRDDSVVKPGDYVALVSREVKTKDGTVPRPDDDREELAVPGALRNTLPPKYNDRDKPLFTATVHAGDNELAPFALKSKP
jgi:hypothetical protein